MLRRKLATLGLLNAPYIHLRFTLLEGYFPSLTM
jgi:hypothetical protein